jgi:hypothetical protein
MDEETKKVFDSLKGGIPSIRDEHKGGHRYKLPEIPDLDYKKEATPIRDTRQIVDTVGPTPPQSQPIEHRMKELPEGWGKGAFDSHKGGTNVFNKGGKK